MKKWRGKMWLLGLAAALALLKGSFIYIALSTPPVEVRSVAELKP